MQNQIRPHLKYIRPVLTSCSGSGSKATAHQLAQISAVSGDVVVQHNPRVGEKGTQRWLRRGAHRYAVHVRSGVVALATGQRLQLLEERIQVAFSAQRRRASMTGLSLQLLAHLEPLQKCHDLLLEISLLQRDRLKGGKTIKIIINICFYCFNFVTIKGKFCKILNCTSSCPLEATRS